MEELALTDFLNWLGPAALIGIVISWVHMREKIIRMDAKYSNLKEEFGKFEKGYYKKIDELDVEIKHMNIYLQKIEVGLAKFYGKK